MVSADMHGAAANLGKALFEYACCSRRLGRCTRARPPWTGWRKSRSGGSPSHPQRPRAHGRTTSSTSLTRQGTSTSRWRWVPAGSSRSCSSLGPAGSLHPTHCRRQRPKMRRRSPIAHVVQGCSRCSLNEAVALIEPMLINAVLQLSCRCRCVG